MSLNLEAAMNKKPAQNRPHKDSAAGGDSSVRSGSSSNAPRTSRFTRFAATQAAGDGIEGDTMKPNKSVDEKIGANMADRK
jgi:hypothetical protein